MAQAQKGDKVKVHCLGKLEDGTTFFNTAQQDPMEVTVGAGQVIPGFDRALEGMASGEKKTIDIPPDDAYGPRREEMVQDITRDKIPPDLNPKVGDTLNLQHESGQAIPVRVTNVSDSTVTLDANHPLAGKNLTFDIHLIDII